MVLLIFLHDVSISILVKKAKQKTGKQKKKLNYSVVHLVRFCTLKFEMI